MSERRYEFPFGDEVDDENVYELVQDIFEYLENLPKTWKRAHVFVDGEGDSNQSEFEMLSNRCRIGVVAYNKETGYALLHFLRIIIDKHPLYFTVMIANKESFTLKDAIKAFEDSESTYGIEIPFGEVLTTTLGRYGNNPENISVNPEDADLWNIARIKQHIWEKYIS